MRKRAQRKSKTVIEEPRHVVQKNIAEGPSFKFKKQWWTAIFLVGIFFIVLLFNAYFDFEIEGPVTPYLTGGLGLAGAKIKDSGTDTDSGNDAVVAYQLGTGVAIDLTDALSLDIRFRYFGTSKMEYENLDLDFANLMGFVGVNMRF